MKHNPIRFALEGHFRFVATRPDGTERVLSDWGQNLILDAGLNRLGTGGAWDTCRVGSGSTAPSNGQTSLETLVASTTTVEGQVGGTAGDNTYSWARRTFRFAAGEAEGNLSEVGVGWSEGLFSRALIKDEGGDPTTITVLSDEVLDVSYEVRAFPVLTDQEMTVDISSVDYDFTLRPAGVAGDHTIGGWGTAIHGLMSAGMTQINGNGMSATAYASGTTLAAVTASGPTGTPLSNAVPSFRSSYSNNSYERECRISYGLTDGTAPFGGFLILTYCGNYQAVVSPDIPKDATKTFSLDFTVSWARR